MRFRNLILMAIAGYLLFGTSCNQTAKSGTENPYFNSKSPKSTDMSAQFLIPWWKALFSFIESERLTPPDVSRMLAYISVTQYEAQICGAPEYRSLAGQLNGLKDLPRPDKNQVYDWPTCVIEATYLVQDDMLSRYFPAGVNTLNTLHDQMMDARKAAGIADDVMQRSLKYGKDLSEAIIDWSDGDHYVETRYKQYKSPSREGHPERWEPTDFNGVPLEPFWDEIRTFALKDNAQCDINNIPPYSDDTTSAFYKAADKVYLTDKYITEQERTLAQYWADCPGETQTPPGHWMYILGTFVESQKMNLAQACELYALCGVSMADVAITIWHTKFRTDLVRPKTYIDEHMEPKWEPYVETPFFPGYTSAHSGFSGASATIMTKLIGDNLPFIDSSHVDIGLLPRPFKSFNDAALEAAYSRLYGGIHYEFEILDGSEQGKCVANYVLNNIITRPDRKMDQNSSSTAKMDNSNSGADKAKNDSY